ncbi:hypothetical protein HDU92_004480 [Lobulomyces angularis]|nr:hypothetical protein HDU92_004480 [Lobulomyces angularis]
MHPVYHIREIQESSNGLSGSSVRVLGKINSLYLNESLAIIEFKETEMLMDLCLLGTDVQKLNKTSLYQFLGDLEDFEEDQMLKNSNISIPKHAGSGAVILKARIFRLMDGLDLNLFEKSLTLKRRFLQEREGLSF